jgi:hypothetical protein
MNEQINKPDDSQGPTPPERSFKMWLIYLPALLFFWFFTLINKPSSAEEITWQQFERDMISRKAIEGTTMCHLGGRAAEEIFVGEISSAL